MKKTLYKHTVLIFAVVIATTSILSGCQFLQCLESLFNPFSAQWRTNSINMFLGESKEVTFDDFSYTGNEKTVSFTLSSSNDDAVVANGHSLDAIGEGSATITARFSNGTYTKITAYVNKTAQNLTLMSRDRSKSTQDNSAIEVYAIINDGKISASKYDIEWEIDGEVINYDGEVFVLPSSSTPTSKRIKATVYNSANSMVSDEVIINRYAPTSSELEISVIEGNITQTSGNENEITFGYTYDLGQNTAPAIEWKINGETKLIDEQTFSFTPLGVGEYEVSVHINDTVASEKVMVIGAKVPHDITFDYDTNYPKAKVSWQGATASGETFTVNLDGVETTVDTNEFVFDASQYSLRSIHQIKVKSNGNGNSLIPSEYSAVKSTKSLTATEIEYLNKKWYDGNYYITSDDEFCEIYDYFMLYREQPVLQNTETVQKVYMAYSSSYSLKDLVQMAFDRPNYTGKYNLGYAQQGNIVTLEFEFQTVSTPAEIGKPETRKQYNGLDLHISNTGNYELPINEWTKTAMVETTDQLYKVVEHGYKPVPTANSRAEKYYDYAKNLLSKIIDEGMSEVEKAHAIYDWIMWRVQYDDNATTIHDIGEATAYGAFYIEGVLTNTQYTAVCDGMSKTYSLLANMCGLKCYRVVGSARSSTTSPVGGHAWNKVLVDGEWYVVDCTWGDQRVSVPYMTIKITRETAMHDYFLKTDAQIADTHFETSASNYPPTSVLPYNLYNETEQLDLVSNGVKYSSYITKETEIDAYATALANSVTEKFVYDSNLKRKYVVCESNYGQWDSYFLMQEVMLSPQLSLTAKSVGETLQDKIKKKGFSCSIIILNNKVSVLISKEYAIK